MTADSTISALNRLLVIHNRSLAQYLSYASPTWHLGDDEARATLRVVAADQHAFVDRLGELILQTGGTVEYGSFPLSYTGYHDLSSDFLLNKLVENQKQNVSAIEQCIPRLSRNPLAKALGEESLGAAKGHLESLQELRHVNSTPAAR
jgi:hypothetical protein